MDISTSQPVITLESVLSRAGRGVELANQVNALVSSKRLVRLDFAAVDRVTPSFTNAFVMSVLEHISVEEYQRQVLLLEQSPHVSSTFERSIMRYQKGIRLSSQTA